MTALDQFIKDLEGRAFSSRLFPIQHQSGAKPHPTRIPWDIADLAYSVYSAKYGREQSLERMAERGGFGPGEMDDFLPDWRERCAARLEVNAQDQRTIKLLCAVVRAQSEALDKVVHSRRDDINPTGVRRVARKAQATIAKLIAEFEKGEV